MIHDEKKNVLTDHEFVIVKGLLKKSKHAYLYTQIKHPVDLRF